VTRQKAWIIAVAATVTVILFVLAAGASFGQFGLGDGGGTRLQASVTGQTERREGDDDHDDRDFEEDDEDEDGDDDRDERDGSDDEHDDDDEHEEEDD
jgi:hypothetical protein